MKIKTPNQSGFSIVEMIMTIILVSIIAAVAIPNFVDLRTDAKNGAAKGALGAIRAAIAVATVAIRLKEDPTSLAPKYPTAREFHLNRFNGSHPVLSGTGIMDLASGVPKNPWSISTYSASAFNTVIDCGTLAKSILFSGTGLSSRGWCYRETSGEAWANSANNSGGSGRTENTY